MIEPESVMRCGTGLLLASLLALCACTSTDESSSLRADLADVAGGAPAPAADLVLLVHGMGRTSLSMLPLAQALEREGFVTDTWGYSSVLHDIPELCALLAAHIAALELPAGTRVHFVGHSLGNLLIRGALGAQPRAGAGRIVMLAPPNRGAASADAWAPWMGWLWKPLPQLGAAGLAGMLPVPPLEIGIIAGELDGKVAPEETHLSGETDHVVVPALHSFLMSRRDVQELTARFLREGRFGPAPAPGDAAPTDATPVDPAPVDPAGSAAIADR
jgi:hypothetical protein